MGELQMKFLKPIEQFKKLNLFDDDFRSSIDRVLDQVGDLVEDQVGSEPSGALLEGELFHEQLRAWCDQNPDTPARLLSITVCDDDKSTTNPAMEDVAALVEEKFSAPLPATQLGTSTLVVHVSENEWPNVANDFDWANQIEGLISALRSEYSSEFVLQSANWPTQASTATTLLDLVVPSDVNIRQKPSLNRNIGSLVRRFLDDKLPERLENRLSSALEDRAKKVSPF
jgi:hypothetical protein